MSTLSPVPLDRYEVSSDAGWFWYTFTLVPTEFCVRYFLHLDSPSQCAAIEINRQTILPANTSPSPVVDVTDYVALDENIVGFRLANPQESIGQIRLLPIACDEL
jgi:hypothetical protein